MTANVVDGVPAACDELTAGAVVTAGVVVRTCMVIDASDAVEPCVVMAADELATGVVVVAFVACVVVT